jgi:hypothetical protein
VVTYGMRGHEILHCLHFAGVFARIVIALLSVNVVRLSAAADETEEHLAFIFRHF